MREPVHLSRTKHEAPAQLKRIPSQLVLLVSFGLRFCSCREIIPPQQMQDVRRLQFQRVIRLLLFVNQERKRNPGLLPERFRVLSVPQTHRGQRRSSRSKFRFMRAQLRRVLPAENSTIVPQKHHHGRLCRPKRSQPDLFSVRIRQHNHRQSAAQLSFHIPSLRFAPTISQNFLESSSQVGKLLLK